MALEEVDLTLGSIFAGDNKPSLRLREAEEYSKKNNDIDARDRILKNHAPKDLMQIFTDAALNQSLGWYETPVDNILFEDDKFKTVDDQCADFYYKLFGKMPAWYKNIDPWSYAYSNENCDCCGTKLNVINSVFQLCSKCDANLEENVNKSSNILTSW